jgi:ElaB/YqjD/DUF883 family membrane-anchored ribosome-binding protein
MDINKGSLEAPINQARNFLVDIAHSAQENSSAAVAEISKAAHENAQLIKDKAEAAVDGIKSGSNDALSSVGEKLTSASAAINDSAKEHPALAPAAKSVAGGLETTGKYLKSHSFGEVGDDIVGLVRQHPVQSITLAIGLGFLLSQAFSRR